MYSKDFRQKVVDTYNTGCYSYRELCDKFEVSIKFIQNLIPNYKKTGSLFKLNKKKTNDFKIRNENEEILKKMVKDNPSMTLKEMSDYFKEHHNFKVGKSSVDRKLKSLGITVKKKRTTIQRRIK